MSLVDIAILCLIALPMIVGVFYGFINIIFSLLSWVISIGLSIKLVPDFAPLLVDYVDTLVLRSILTFISLFILSLFIMSGISYLIVKLLDQSGLTAADRFFGLLFGMGLGCFIVAVTIFMVGFTAFPQASWWKESKLTEPFEQISVWGTQFLPESFLKYHSY